MISDFPRLRQLDLEELSASEKRDAGLDVSSDEESGSEEDDDPSDNGPSQAGNKFMYSTHQSGHSIHFAQCLLIL